MQIALEKFTLDWQENNPFLTPEEEALLQNAIDNPNVHNEFVPKDYKKLIEDRKRELANDKAVPVSNVAPVAKGVKGVPDGAVFERTVGKPPNEIHFYRDKNGTLHTAKK